MFLDVPWKAPEPLITLCLKALDSGDAPEIVGYPCDPGDPSPLQTFSERVRREVWGDRDKDNRVSGLVARLVEQRELIPVIDTTDQKPPPGPWLFNLLGEQGRAIVIAPSSWNSGMGLASTTLRVEAPR